MIPTLGLRAYDELRRMLVQGRLQPGMQLVNRKLAEEIGMSMTPVREAVTRLASEGFVDHVPGAGSFVRRMSRHELAQLYDVRLALEPLAAAEAAENASAAEIAELRSITADSFKIVRAIAAAPGRHATPQQMTRWLDDEQRFHEVLFQAARNRWLTKIAADLKLLAFGFSPQRRMPEFLCVAAAVNAWRGHRRLIRALATRDPLLAATTTASHVAQGKQEVLMFLDSHRGRKPDAEAGSIPRPGIASKPTGRTEAAGLVSGRTRDGSPRMSARAGKDKAFTLIELLVVIVILAILVGIMLPMIRGIREGSQRSQCMNNLRTIGLAMQAFEHSQREFPIGCDSGNGLGWRVYVLPHLDQQALFDRFDLGPGPFNGGANREGPNKSVWATNRMPMYLCPSATRHIATDGSSTLSNPVRQTFNSQYYGVAGPIGAQPISGQPYPFTNIGVYGGWARSGMLFMDSRVKAGDVRDGLSSTLMVGELAVVNVSSWTSGWHGGGDGGNWVRGAGVTAFPLTGTGATKNVRDGINVPPVAVGDINSCSFSSFHQGGGANFARGDASTVFLGEDIALDIYKFMCSRSGQEPGEAVND
jgi:prepilin-type N-terminal cleavage/methylation domain-containing protein